MNTNIVGKKTGCALVGTIGTIFLAHQDTWLQAYRFFINWALKNIIFAVNSRLYSFLESTVRWDKSSNLVFQEF